MLILLLNHTLRHLLVPLSLVARKKLTAYYSSPFLNDLHYELRGIIGNCLFLVSKGTLLNLTLLLPRALVTLDDHYDLLSIVVGTLTCMSEDDFSTVSVVITTTWHHHEHRLYKLSLRGRLDYFSTSYAALHHVSRSRLEITSSFLILRFRGSLDHVGGRDKVPSDSSLNSCHIILHLRCCLLSRISD